MPSVVAYHRPTSLKEATALLARPGCRALAGGTVVVPDARTVRPVGVELVDLQDLGLEQVEAIGGVLTLGAMVRLGDLANHPAAPPLLAELALRELPSTMRYQATVGGTVAQAGPDSLLFAGLLVHEATVTFVGPGGTQQTVALASLPASGAGPGPCLITAVTVAGTGTGAVAATGRTPADDPIVAAVASRGPDGQLHLALTGVAPHPLLVDPDDPTGGLDPPGDFRGSVPYRLHLARVLSTRALAQLAGTR
jgi:carbon-monoxide dehydrogenase medium subunit